MTKISLWRKTFILHFDKLLTNENVLSSIFAKSGPCLFLAIWVTKDSQLLDRLSSALLHSTTSVSPKQYPAFSTQMEATPYASRPLSFHLGNQLYTSQGSRRRTEVFIGTRLQSHLHTHLVLTAKFSEEMFGEVLGTSHYMLHYL